MHARYQMLLAKKAPWRSPPSRRHVWCANEDCFQGLLVRQWTLQFGYHDIIQTKASYLYVSLIFSSSLKRPVYTCTGRLAQTASDRKSENSGYQSQRPKRSPRQTLYSPGLNHSAWKPIKPMCAQALPGDHAIRIHCHYIPPPSWYTPHLRMIGYLGRS